MSTRLSIFVTMSENDLVNAVVDTLNDSYVRDITAIELMHALAKEVTDEDFTIYCDGDYKYEFVAKDHRNDIEADADAIEWLNEIKKQI